MKFKLFNYDITIQKRVKKNKFKAMRSPANEKLVLDIEKIIFLKYELGWSNRKIAKEFQVSEATIRNRLKSKSSVNVIK